MKIPNIKTVLVSSLFVCLTVIVVLSALLRSARYEIRLQTESNQNLSDFADFQNSNHIVVTSNLNQRIKFLEHTNK
jgi:hypothetical protein